MSAAGEPAHIPTGPEATASARRALTATAHTEPARPETPGRRRTRHRVGAALTWAICAMTAAAPGAEAQGDAGLLSPDSARLRCRMAHDRILDAVRGVHHAQKNVGLSAAVAVHGTVEFSEQLGLADLEHRVAVGPATRFGVASVTKAFTGAALVKLARSGELDLHAPIQRYVPGFPEKPGPPITPHLLAVHRAGIRHYRPGERTPAFYAAHFESAVQVLELFQDDTLLFEPGSDYSYSSYGYNLLAAAIEAASGRSFPEYVRGEVLAPLGLARTRFDDVRFPLEDRSERYSFYHPRDYRPSDSVWLVPRWDYSYNMGGGNLISTAEDLVRFGQAFVGPGFLDEEGLALVRELQGPTDEGGPWSYGWFVLRDEAGRTFLRINGSNAGLQASLVVYPEHAVSVAVLSNTWGLGSRSGEMVVELPARMVRACLGEAASPKPSSGAWDRRRATRPKRGGP